MAGVLCSNQADKDKKRSGIYRWLLAFRNDILAKAQKKLLQGARPMDNLEYTLDLPMEEVFAQATISTQAISHMLVFPDGGNGVKYIETAFIDEQDEKRQQEWRKAYD